MNLNEGQYVNLIPRLKELSCPSVEFDLSRFTGNHIGHNPGGIVFAMNKNLFVIHQPGGYHQIPVNSD